MMNKEQTVMLQDALSILAGKPLRFLYRFLNMVCLEFGELLDEPVMPQNEAEKGVLVPEKAGMYSLQAQSAFRMLRSHAPVFTSGDLYEPSSSALARLGLQAEDVLPDDFEFGVPGNSLLDEAIVAHFQSTEGFVVASVSVSRLGDLRVRFDNGFEFQILIDETGPEECWRFFKFDEEEDMVITGQGLVVDG